MKTRLRKAPMPKAIHLLLALLLLAAVLPLGAQDDADPAAPTAWDDYQERHPGAANDDRLGPLLREMLHAMTPAQASAFLDGADPSTIGLADGGTLADLLAASLAGGGPELVYVPLVSCRLFGTWFQGSPGPPMIADEVRTLFARGTDLSAQGGSATGCGIPTEAVAFMAQLRVMQPTAKGLIKAWPAGGVVADVPTARLRPRLR